MPLPDVVLNVKSAISSRTPPSGTGTAFFAGITQRGSSAAARLCLSLQDFLDNFGARLTSSPLYDAVETFFAEGGFALYVSRVLGAGAAQASITLYDSGGTSSGNASLVVKAGSLGDADPGTWGNALSVEVIAVTGGYQLNVYLSSVLVESSYTLVTQADAVGWAKSNSKYVVISLGASSNVPVAVAPTALTGGTDGSAVNDAAWQAALNLFDADLGAGQVAAPGRTTSAGQLQLLAHAVACNRFALLDLTDTATTATLVAAAQALYSAPNNGRRWGQAFAPWDVIPGLTVATTRTVPPCARAAAQYAKVDALGNPNQAAAGKYGTAQFVLDLSQPAWTDADRKTLNEAGVTVSRRRFRGAIVTYGLRTLADQVNDAQWSSAPNVRCVMAFNALADIVGEDQQFGQVDGQGRALSTFKGALIGVAKGLYDIGALYGETPQEAYAVDVGPSINTTATLAAGEKHARVALRTSPNNERTIIDIVKYPITQALA